jgi:hypothetical protein
MSMNLFSLYANGPGDVGGGAGMLAYRRVTNPNKRAVDMYNDGHNFGGWLNLEGDIAAYLVARNPDSFDKRPGVNLGDDDYIADALAQYLLPQPAEEGSEWHQRARIFLEMLGGEFDSSGNLTNEEELIEDLSVVVEDFAENYVINMSLSRDDVDLYEVSKHLDGASKEMTDIFIKTLITATGNPGNRVQAQGYDPSPSAPGTPYHRYRVLKGVNDFKKKIEDWFNNGNN